MATVNEVAGWMLAELHRDGVLHQAETATQIEDRFGADFVYDNSNGNLAIAKGVLKAFRTVSGAQVVWERGSRLWRLRDSFDEPGRRQP